MQSSKLPGATVWATSQPPSKVGLALNSIPERLRAVKSVFTTSSAALLLFPMVSRVLSRLQQVVSPQGAVAPLDAGEATVRLIRAGAGLEQLIRPPSKSNHSNRFISVSIGEAVPEALGRPDVSRLTTQTSTGQVG